jgi:hypothetical protein
MEWGAKKCQRVILKDVRAVEGKTGPLNMRNTGTEV